MAKALYLALLLTLQRAANAGGEVLKFADVLTYRQLRVAGLSNAERDRYCCTSAKEKGFMTTDVVSFKPQDGYFVRVTVDALAYG